ncbi:MAG: hypothetical protein PHQ43_01185 [Dehalococcoidales bacterium]|nr:hypothetical protein [Dehalococcoidales bacterium]
MRTRKHDTVTIGTAPVLTKAPKGLHKGEYMWVYTHGSDKYIACGNLARILSWSIRSGDRVTFWFRKHPVLLYWDAPSSKTSYQWRIERWERAA